MYFDDCTNLEELKKLYKKLCFKYHPDLNGGDGEEMKLVNAEYDVYLKKLAFCYNADESHKDTYDYTKDMFAEIIQKIIHFTNMDIEIIGNWIWCFNSYEYHEQLKELGFWYSGSKKAWVYSGTSKTRYRSKNSVDDLRNKWGSEKVQTTKQFAIA